MNYRYQRVMMNISQFKRDDWYQFGRFRDEQDVGDAYTFSEDRIIRRTLLCGMIRENRYELLEHYLPSYFYHNYFDSDMVQFATNREMVDYLSENKEWCHVNLYRYPYMIGKCRILPLKKLKRWIDGVTKNKRINSEWSEFDLSPDDQYYLIECMKASVENKDSYVFDYLYKKYREFKLDRIVRFWHIINEAVFTGNKLLLERLLPLAKSKELNKISSDYQSEIKEIISKISLRNILVFEKIQGTIHPKIPKDVTKYIINKFIFPDI